MCTYVSCHVGKKKQKTFSPENEVDISREKQRFAYAGLTTCLPVFSITYISSFILVTIWRQIKSCCCSSPQLQRLLISDQTLDLPSQPRKGEVAHLEPWVFSDFYKLPQESSLHVHCSSSRSKGFQMLFFLVNTGIAYQFLHLYPSN